MLAVSTPPAAESHSQTLPSQQNMIHRGTASSSGCECDNVTQCVAQLCVSYQSECIFKFYSELLGEFEPWFASTILSVSKKMIFCDDSMR